MEEVQRKDTLNIQTSKDLTKLLKKNEKLYWSGELTKINKRKRRQVRRFVLTDSRFFNLGDDKFMDQMIAFFKGNKSKRSVKLEDISFITYSETGNEFVLHVPKEYDYRLCSAQHRDEFIYFLLQLRERLIKEQVKIYVRPEIELERYTKNDDETQMKLPGGDPKAFGSAAWKIWYEDRKNKRQENINQTETIINTIAPGQKLSEDDFDIIKVLGRGAFGKVSLCQKRGTDDLYAIKIMSKADIIERNQIEQIKSEKDILK